MEIVIPRQYSKNTFFLEGDRASTEVINNWIDNLRGIRHLHSLGIIHNDINPANMMFDTCNGNTPVIIDFDSCRPKGHRLTIVKRTYEWADDNVKEAMPENDFNALREITYIDR